jgi:hypothetical protein
MKTLWIRLVPPATWPSCAARIRPISVGAGLRGSQHRLDPRERGLGGPLRDPDPVERALVLDTPAHLVARAVGGHRDRVPAQIVGQIDRERRRHRDLGQLEPLEDAPDDLEP